MAITSEQAAAIATAIENLNKSVQVNEEVLQIVKSMQTTGAAGSIAEHDADANAHENGIYSFFANEEIKVKSRTFNPSKETVGNPWAAVIGTTKKDNTYGNGVITFYSRLEREVNTYYPATRFEVALDKSVDAAESSRTMGAVTCGLFNDSKGAYEHIANLIFGYGSVLKDFYSSWGVARKDGGANTTLNLWPSCLLPSSAIDLGSTTFQWKDLYLQNAPIVSSDRRLKQDFSEVPEAVFKAWANVKFCQYRFKEAVEKKGAEARLHVGLIAQEIVDAFKAHGLDATKYGIVCHDSWEDQYQDVEVGTKPAVLNEKGEVVKPEEPIMEHQLIKKAGDLWTVRYEEALALEAAYQRWKLQKIEAALAEKGISL